MSNVIDLLERLGQDSDLRHADGNQLAQLMSSANVSPELRAAIAEGDQSKIEKLLGAKANVCAIIFPVDTEAAHQENAVNRASVGAR
jgi:hypothetical protein